MLIKSLELNNIRSYESVSIDFNKGVTVITGRTGSGKSTLLMSIEYALFGSKNINNSSIIRRGADKSSIKLSFEHNDDDYKIIRGLKRTGDKVITDSDNIRIIKNNKSLLIINRVRDLDKKIRELLQYPDNVKPYEMFEITSYTRQDEIKSIIDMSPEQRQEYIDRLLQLSKYKMTYNNLRSLVNYYEKELERLSELKKHQESIKEDIEKNEEKKEDKEKKISKKEEELKKINKEYEKNKKLLKKVRKKYEEYDEKLSEKKDLRTLITSEKKVVQKLKKENEELLEEISALNKRKKKLSDKSFEKTQSVLVNKKSGEETIKNRLERLEKKSEKLISVENKCPLCGQKITEKHIKKIREEIINEKKELKNNLKEIEEIIPKLEKEVENIELRRRISNKTKNKNKIIEKNKKDINESIERIKRKKKKYDKIKVDEDKIKNLKKELDELNNNDKKLYSNLNSLRNSLEIFRQEKKDIIKGLRDKRSKLENINKELSNKVVLKKYYNLTKKLRKDIKNIRKVIRRRFLSDFRHEFQKKFEEIRREENEYSVEVSNNYEPVAYASNGEEVDVSFLSGGERTSVALSYRLALASLAANMMSVSPSEILILDEPTTGFDKDDIKILPETLRNIENIPQIIIVTHEELLKEAADYTIKVEKVNNVSRIS